MSATIIIMMSILCVILIPSALVELLVEGTKTELDEMGVFISKTSH